MRRIHFALAALAQAAFIYYLSDRPAGEIRTPLSGASLSFLHLPLHGALAAFLVRALAGDSPGIGPWPGLRSPAGALALAAAILHGVLDEIHQFFVPGRTCSVFDVLLDACGALAVLTLPWLRGRGRPATPVPFGLAIAAGLAAAYLLPGWLPGVDGALAELLRDAGFVER